MTKINLKELSTSSGIYQYLNTDREIIYVGKAINLKKRIQSYFNKTHGDKTDSLVAEIDSVELIETNSEFEALLLEAELIKRNKPKYNILSRDDRNYIYIKITKDEYPVISYVRTIENDNANYYGPYMSLFAIKKAMREIRKAFPYITSRHWPKVSKLDYQIGRSPKPDCPRDEYIDTINYIKRILRGDTKLVLSKLISKRNRLSKQEQFEEAAKLQKQIVILESLAHKNFLNLDNIQLSGNDLGISGLEEILNIRKINRIEGYDISNLSGLDAVSSMVVFTNGFPDNKQYRKFKMSIKGPNDFAMMQETLTRRIKRNWDKPDAILIDGGKGQLSSVLSITKGTDFEDIPTFGLAKKLEEIYIYDPEITKLNEKYKLHSYRDNDYLVVRLPENHPSRKLIQRIRDEAHRFAITYHKTIRNKRINKSSLENIDGVGRVTAKKLLKHFKSVEDISNSNVEQLKSAGVSENIALKIVKFFK